MWLLYIFSRKMSMVFLIHLTISTQNIIIKLVNFTFGKVILCVIFAFEQVNWCQKWRCVRNLGDLSLFFREII